MFAQLASEFGKVEYETPEKTRQSSDKGKHDWASVARKPFLARPLRRKLKIATACSGIEAVIHALLVHR